MRLRESLSGHLERNSSSPLARMVNLLPKRKGGGKKKKRRHRTSSHTATPESELGNSEDDEVPVLELPARGKAAGPSIADRRGFNLPAVDIEEAPEASTDVKYVNSMELGRGRPKDVKMPEHKSKSCMWYVARFLRYIGPDFHKRRRKPRRVSSDGE